MKQLALLLALLIAITCEAKDNRSFWQKLFSPAKPKVVKKRVVVHHHRRITKTRVTQSETPRNGKGYFIVDSQWYAEYLAMESARTYWIYDDKDIEFMDGKFHVPPVVYRHYEDMKKAKLTAPALLEIK